MCKPLDPIRLFIVLAGIFCVLSSVVAQDDSQKARLRFVCATDSTTAITCSVNDQSLRPQGLPSGYRTGLLSFNPGNYKIRAEHSELGELDVSLELKSGDNKCLIFFTEEEKHDPAQETNATSKKSKSAVKNAPPKKELSFFMLEAVPNTSQERFLTILQLTPKETLELGIFDSIHHIPRLHPVRDHTNSQFRAITHQGRLLTQFEMMKVQEYQLIIFQGTDGNLHTIHHGTR